MKSDQKIIMQQRSESVTAAFTRIRNELGSISRIYGEGSAEAVLFLSAALEGYQSSVRFGADRMKVEAFCRLCDGLETQPEKNAFVKFYRHLLTNEEYLLFAGSMEKQLPRSLSVAA